MYWVKVLTSLATQTIMGQELHQRYLSCPSQARRLVLLRDALLPTCCWAPSSSTAGGVCGHSDSEQESDPFCACSNAFSFPSSQLGVRHIGGCRGVDINCEYGPSTSGKMLFDILRLKIRCMLQYLQVSFSLLKRHRGADQKKIVCLGRKTGKSEERWGGLCSQSGYPTHLGPYSCALCVLKKMLLAGEIPWGVSPPFPFTKAHWSMLDRNAEHLGFSVFVWANLDKLLYPRVSKLFCW